MIRSTVGGLDRRKCLGRRDGVRARLRVFANYLWAHTQGVAGLGEVLGTLSECSAGLREVSGTLSECCCRTSGSPAEHFLGGRGLREVLQSISRGVGDFGQHPLGRSIDPQGVRGTPPGWVGPTAGVFGEHPLGGSIDPQVFGEHPPGWVGPTRVRFVRGYGNPANRGGIPDTWVTFMPRTSLRARPGGSSLRRGHRKGKV